MFKGFPFPLAILAFCLPIWCLDSARSSEEEERAAIAHLADSSADVRKAAIAALSKSGDMRLKAFFDDFNDGNVRLWKDRVVICVSPQKETAILDPLTRQPLPETPLATPEIAKALKDLSPTRRERNQIKDAVSFLGLFSPDNEVRREAAVKSANVDSSLPMLRELQKSEKDSRVRFSIDESVALLELASADGKTWSAEQFAAIKRLGELTSGRAFSRIKELRDLNEKNSKNPEAAAVTGSAIQRIESWQSTAHGISHLFSGLSLGSILILMALGLSIIFGLMGVINMAHGELMMIGAYATYVTQKAFEMAITKNWISAGGFDWFFVLAIPLSFVTAAFVGYLMERLVIRYLYGRPLDSLLATWGISYILIQAVRLTFGNNIGVNSPSWLRGGVEIVQDVNLPYNRLFIIGFCALCILLMYLLIEKTKMGLLLRATTQNRNMAASLGVHTRQIDGYTFALGAGLAGMAGCALTQIGGVTPDMGSNYIVDSFMTVVTGGVGKLAGAIWAGLGLGLLNKGFEAFFAAVWGKVLILICVVLFIQRRPSGLFPAKGRLADV